MTPTVCGIDISLQSTGVAIPELIDGQWVVRQTRVRTTGKKTATLTDRHNRLGKIVNQIRAAIPVAADLVVIEQPAYSRVGGSNHDRSGLWWRTVAMVYDAGWPIAEVTPSGRTKYALGRGGGKDTDKDHVLAAVIKRYPHMDITGNDVADATLLACMGLDYLGFAPVVVPQLHRAALDAVRWPAPPPGVSAPALFDQPEGVTA